jgi:hypothetical protein
MSVRECGHFTPHLCYLACPLTEVHRVFPIYGISRPTPPYNPMTIGRSVTQFEEDTTV